MSNLVIVAIPAEDDYVWKISSEKVPHMTLLFLGDIEGKPVTKIQEFLEHAVTILEIGPFGMDVDYRGVLGPDEADVLFFRKDYWSYKRISEFRGQLLKNTPIKTAYDSTAQYDEWTPHLTLGYPATPAKEDTRDYPGIHWVQFDKIALWYGDYEGPEFRLTYKYDLNEVAMSDASKAGAAFISHYGVKGMHWGQRKTPTPTEVHVQSIVRSPNAAKTKVKATGGENHPATEDALKAAAQKQKLKKSGAHALTNTELRQLADRMNLEQQVARLATNEPKSAGKQFVESLASDPNRTIGNINKTVENATKVGELALKLRP
jgi:2'-5' RNA ligase